jgi:hypothetical protein
MTRLLTYSLSRRVHARTHTLPFFQLYYKLAVQEGCERGDTAERIVIFDAEYLLDKNYSILTQDRIVACD